MKMPPTGPAPSRLAIACTLAALACAACAPVPPRAAAPSARTASTAGCPGAEDTTHRQLIGTWTAEVQGGAAARIALRPHPELAQSVRGTVERGGTTAQAAGDVDDGDLTLEESENGKNISATWIGRVVDGSCGKEIRGTWTHAQDNRPLPFVLRKQAGSP
ncbi:hypothetical protein [Paracidovorax konjaci]|uniref:Lipoprotein n=1 Tax=Paracidovorax konjaci TaxID=32040 RepID=A0A1I1Y7E2_9BURK|nr:hypothetical protein [Paracidovorax konjaci]SFE15555.1 hypothetical protein SAMN04489710_11639 [Paracidovorax konjaci]